MEEFYLWIYHHPEGF